MHKGNMASWIRQVPGFRSRRWWKSTLAVLGYAVIFLLITGGLFGGTVHWLVTNVVGLPALVVSLKVGPLVDALGPPYVATQAFLMLVYILNARASTFLLGAESLAVMARSKRLGHPILYPYPQFPFENCHCCWVVSFDIPWFCGACGYPGKEAVGIFESVKDG